jgi:peptide deformylase
MLGAVNILTSHIEGLIERFFEHPMKQLDTFIYLQRLTR